MPTIDATDGHIDVNDTGSNATGVSDARTWMIIADQKATPTGPGVIIDNKQTTTGNLLVVRNARTNVLTLDSNGTLTPPYNSPTHAAKRRNLLASGTDTTNDTDYLLAVTQSLTVVGKTIRLHKNARPGLVVIIKAESTVTAGANIVCTRQDSTYTIDGGVSVVVTSTSFGSGAFYSDGTNWYTIWKT